MNLLLLNLRPPGGGVTSSANALIGWIDKHPDHQITHGSIRIPARACLQYVRVINGFTDEELHHACRTHDQILINTGFAASVKEAEAERWMGILRQHKANLTYYCQDIFNTKRWYFAYDFFIEHSRQVLTNSVSSPFASRARELQQSVRLSQPSLDFDAIRAECWQPIAAQDVHTHRMIGRYNAYKNHAAVFKFYEDWLKVTGDQLYIEGVDKSPSFNGFTRSFDFVLGETYTQTADKPIVFGSYTKAEMYQRLARTGFSWQLQLAKPDYLVQHLEHTQMESVACGSTVILHSSWFRNHPLKFLLDDDSILWFKESETLYHQIQGYQREPELKDLARERIFEVFNQHYGPNTVFNNLIKALL